MENVVYWFSGTGNSRLVASRIAKGLEERGVPARLAAIEAIPRPRFRMAAAKNWFAPEGNVGPGLPVDAEGLDVLCFPVFSFSAPAIVERFLTRIPVAMGRRAAVVATMGSGGYEGRALARTARLLRESGRKVVLTEVFEMPEAFVQAYPATEEAIAGPLTAAGLVAADRAAADLVEGRTRLRKAGFGGRALTWIASVAFKYPGRRILGLAWSASKACTACGLCAAACPSRTIRMVGGRPHWGGSCEDCQRCANCCPAGAIRVSAPKLVLLAAPLFMPWGRWGDALAGVPGGGTEVIFWLVGAVAGTALVGAILWVLDLVPGLRRLLAASWAGGFRRRLAPDFAAYLASHKRGASRGRGSAATSGY